jgi:hypothetical protein
VFSVEAHGTVEVGFLRGCFYFSIHKTEAQTRGGMGQLASVVRLDFELARVF